MTHTRARRAIVATGLALVSLTLLSAQRRGPLDPAAGRILFVAPDGLRTGDGSRERPFDLPSVLASGGPAKPGDLVWLRGGRYAAPFLSTLNGTAGAPITVRGYPGERAILDGRGAPSVHVLTVRGQWVVYRDFEVTNSDPSRVLPDVSSLRGTGVEVFGANTAFRNLIVHDTGMGFGVWVEAQNAELSGNLVFNNGWEGPDRGHGHGIYSQNREGVKRIVDNVVFNQFSHGIHIYGSRSASLDNFEVDGNIAFNNGAASRTGYTRNILIGGEGTLSHLKVERNLTYFPAAPDAENNVGYNGGCRDVSIRQNVFAGTRPLTLAPCSEIVMQGNTFAGDVPRAMRDAYPDNAFEAGAPQGVRVVTRPDRREPGQGWIVVYNWTRAASVSVALDDFRPVAGARYDIVDAQDPFGPPIASIRHDGRPVVLPMTAHAPSQPLGSSLVLTSTAPEFAVFRVRPEAAVPREGTGR